MMRRPGDYAQSEQHELVDGLLNWVREERWRRRLAPYLSRTRSKATHGLEESQYIWNGRRTTTQPWMIYTAIIFGTWHSQMVVKCYLLSPSEPAVAKACFVCKLENAHCCVPCSSQVIVTVKICACSFEHGHDTLYEPSLASPLRRKKKLSLWYLLS